MSLWHVHEWVDDDRQYAPGRSYIVTQTCACGRRRRLYADGSARYDWLTPAAARASRRTIRRILTAATLTLWLVWGVTGLVMETPPGWLRGLQLVALAPSCGLLIGALILEIRGRS
jgi:hypothetical protein